MAKSKARPPRPEVILPDADDDADESPTLVTPDDDGWVYLTRSAKPKEPPRGKQAKPKAKRGKR